MGPHRTCHQHHTITFSFQKPRLPTWQVRGKQGEKNAPRERREPEPARNLTGINFGIFNYNDSRYLLKIIQVTNLELSES